MGSSQGETEAASSRPAYKARFQGTNDKVGRLVWSGRRGVLGFAWIAEEVECGAHRRGERGELYGAG